MKLNPFLLGFLALVVLIIGDQIGIAKGRKLLASEIINRGYTCLDSCAWEWHMKNENQNER